MIKKSIDKNKIRKGAGVSLIPKIKPKDVHYKPNKNNLKSQD